mgnify:CR=1 FL=1|tara:strand:+ start:905 stop:1333 length:429 start_codon:yes stop_codon:yes gene_type:complete
MRTKTINCYTFDELSDKAKENVKYTLCTEYEWMSEAIQSFESFANEIGITITGYGIDAGCSSRSYIRWRGTPHSRFIKEDLTGYFMDHTLTKTWNNTRDVDECFEKLLSYIQKDYKSQWDDEYIIEMCETNKYEFDEQGNLI